MSQKKYYILSSILLVVTVLIYFFRTDLHIFYRNTLLSVENAEGLTPDEVVAELPSSISNTCKGWIKKALMESESEARGRLIQSLPLMAVSDSSAANEDAENRDLINICQHLDQDPWNAATFEDNIERALNGFKDSDGGDLSRAVQEIKTSCAEELENNSLGLLTYDIWKKMNPGKTNPCE